MRKGKNMQRMLQGNTIKIELQKLRQSMLSVQRKEIINSRIGMDTKYLLYLQPMDASIWSRLKQSREFGS